MVKFICLFFPAFLTIKSEDLKCDSKILLIKKYIFYNLLINIIILSIVNIKNKFIPISLGDTERFNSHFSLEYLIVATILALFLPKIIELIKNNFIISFKGKTK